MRLFLPFYVSKTSHFQMRTVLLLSLLAAISASCGMSALVAQNDPAATPYCVLSDFTSLIPATDPRCSASSPKAAWGSYTHDSNTTGWHTLRITTNESLSEWDQAFAAGFFEGASSVQEIYDFYLNQVKSIAVNPKVFTFFQDNINFMDNIVQKARSDPSSVTPATHMMARVWMQFKGIAAGYASAAGNSRVVESGIIGLWMTGTQADFYDIIGIYPASAEEADRQWNWEKLSPAKFDEWFALRTHCSSLVRHSPDGDLLFGHVTWQTFTFAVRIYKIVTINYADTPAKTMSYSSYPATLSSTDDFHVLDSGLAVMETSFSVFNASVFDSVVPTTVLTSLRTAAANRLASTARQWVSIFSEYNSGTYNNQWQVLEVPKVSTPGASIPVGTFLAVEQMPGLIATTDMAPFLNSKEGYWPSYNVPYNKEIFNNLGYPGAVARQGVNMLSYDQCVRARIFKQRAPLVTNMQEMQQLLQYNDYQHDPISQGNPVYAISARGDLSATGPSSFGGLDCKVSNIPMMKNLQTLAFSGPTPQQPVFDFSTTKARIGGSHIGVPNAFNFSWVTYSP